MRLARSRRTWQIDKRNQNNNLESTLGGIVILTLSFLDVCCVDPIVVDPEFLRQSFLFLPRAIDE